MPARLIPGLCAVLLAAGICSAQPKGDEILKRIDTSYAPVQDYAVDLDVVADLERMNVPPMHVRMYYKKPDKFHFDAEGFALLPREGLAFSPSRLLSRYTVEEVGEDTLFQKSQYTLVLRPRDDRMRASKLTLYVDRQEWKPTRVVSSLPGGQTVTATFLYERSGSYLMPSRLIVEFSTPASTDTTDQSPESDMSPLQRPRMPRKGVVTIRYSHYDINTGLSDDIFNKK